MRTRYFKTRKFKAAFPYEEKPLRQLQRTWVEHILKKPMKFNTITLWIRVWNVIRRWEQLNSYYLRIFSSVHIEVILKLDLRNDERWLLWHVTNTLIHLHNNIAPLNDEIELWTQLEIKEWLKLRLFIKFESEIWRKVKTENWKKQYEKIATVAHGKWNRRGTARIVQRSWVAFPNPKGPVAFCVTLFRHSVLPLGIIR